MEYVRKTCPTCGKEFIVLRKVEEKAIYCTLECLLSAQGKINIKIENKREVRQRANFSV